MQTEPARGLFITGTNTEVGKTYVAAMIARAAVAAGHRVGVYKPAASGCRREGDELIADDAVTLWEAAGRPGRLEDVSPQRYVAPLAPHLAARAEGKEIDPERLRTGLEAWRGGFDLVIVEGAGGLMSPMGDDDYNATLAEEFGYPLIVVAPNELGTINQTLQTLITAVAFGDGLEVAGVVLNGLRPDASDESQASNRTEIEQRCVPPILASVDYGATEFEAPVDWLALAGRPT
ncbi:MAG: dethiobiotin synthase [Planctomycetota bacterium]|nr:MAG: dethiobiotin synthase [Planctomycetota bacterium]REJ89939.1 MAG: dethiobiotin synthase [Planctomycetota bacterium]REK28171.1 MAG: dethiobiotin synthase [Planctomycetota bacterium]REK42429.1 MAG: dethiobiotin synthase [Planctomycetota bacterium]